jgi:hypothetical protein
MPRHFFNNTASASLSGVGFGFGALTGAEGFGAGSAGRVEGTLCPVISACQGD